MIKDAQSIRIDSEVLVPSKASIDPNLMPLFISAGHHKEFHLHLFKFARAEDEVSWSDFITK